jgi:hypothetical protein
MTSGLKSRHRERIFFLLRMATGVSRSVVTMVVAQLCSNGGIRSALTACLSHIVYAAMNTPVMSP